MYMYGFRSDDSNKPSEEINLQTEAYDTTSDEEICIWIDDQWKLLNERYVKW